MPANLVARPGHPLFLLTKSRVVGGHFQTKGMSGAPEEDFGQRKLERPLFYDAIRCAPMNGSRRRFLERAAIAAALGLTSPSLRPPSLRFGAASTSLRAQGTAAAPPQVADLHLVNGRFHTMDATTRVVSQVWIRNGRFAGVGNNLSTQGNPRRIDLRNRTVIPGIVDAHNHIVLVGNRPGWHTPLEHVFTIPDCIAVLQRGEPLADAHRGAILVMPIHRAVLSGSGERLANGTPRRRRVIALRRALARPAKEEH